MVAAVRLLRGLLPAFSLTLVIAAIAWINPRAMSYFGFNLMLSLALPIVLATLAQMFVIAGGELDLSIGAFISFCGCVVATWLDQSPLMGVAILFGGILVYAGLGALIHLRNLPSIVVTLATMVIFRQSLSWARQGELVTGMPSYFQWFGQRQSIGGERFHTQRSARYALDELLPRIARAGHEQLAANVVARSRATRPPAAQVSIQLAGQLRRE